METHPKKMINNNGKRGKKSNDKFNANNVDSLSVIREVKKYPVIYDMEHVRYHDQTYRAAVWKKICIALYPNYAECSTSLQSQMGALVRRRWKSVRNYIAQETKLMITTEYCRKRESTQWAELQFILPYIKSPYCEQIAAELGVKRLDVGDPPLHEPSSKKDHDDLNNGQSSEYSESEHFVIREFKEEEPFENTDEDDPDFQPEEYDDYLSPIQIDSGSDKQLETSTTATTTECPSSPASSTAVHPVVLHYNVDPVTTPPPMLTPKPSTHNCCHQSKNDETEPPRKRPCLDNSTSTEEVYNSRQSEDMQRKLLDLLINIEHRQLQSQVINDVNDLDRMFFMSLVADFKQIPANKKISVKAKIATIIAEAMD